MAVALELFLSCFEQGLRDVFWNILGLACYVTDCLEKLAGRSTARVSGDLVGTRIRGNRGLLICCSCVRVSSVQVSKWNVLRGYWEERRVVSNRSRRIETVRPTSVVLVPVRSLRA